MPKTLLAVDDSATMRKVLEITFGGEDFRVVTADGASSALSRLGEEPVAAVIDTSLGSDDGYALAKEMRVARQPRLALVIMASRYAPYDANRGRDAGVDDYIDKPFDTQALIDKVKKALVSRETARSRSPRLRPPRRPLRPASSSLTPLGPRLRPRRVPAPVLPGAAPAKACMAHAAHAHAVVRGGTAHRSASGRAAGRSRQPPVPVTQARRSAAGPAAARGGLARSGAGGVPHPRRSWRLPSRPLRLRWPPSRPRTASSRTSWATSGSRRSRPRRCSRSRARSSSASCGKSCLSSPRRSSRKRSRA